MPSYLTTILGMIMFPMFVPVKLVENVFNLPVVKYVANNVADYITIYNNIVVPKISIQYNMLVFMYGVMYSELIDFYTRYRNLIDQFFLFVIVLVITAILLVVDAHEKKMKRLRRVRVIENY